MLDIYVLDKDSKKNNCKYVKSIEASFKCPFVCHRHWMHKLLLK